MKKNKKLKLTSKEEIEKILNEKNKKKLVGKTIIEKYRRKIRNEQEKEKIAKIELDNYIDDEMKIDATVYQIGKKNGLLLREINFIDKYIKSNFTATEAYRKTYDRNCEKSGKTGFTRNALDAYKKPHCEKTLKDVLVELDITPEKILDKHLEIRDNAFKNKDFSNSRECNRDFLKILKIFDNDENSNKKITNFYLDKVAILLNKKDKKK